MSAAAQGCCLVEDGKQIGKLHAVQPQFAVVDAELSPRLCIGAKLHPRESFGQRHRARQAAQHKVG